MDKTESTSPSLVSRRDVLRGAAIGVAAALASSVPRVASAQSAPTAATAPELPPVHPRLGVGFVLPANSGGGKRWQEQITLGINRISSCMLPPLHTHHLMSCQDKVLSPA